MASIHTPHRLTFGRLGSLYRKTLGRLGSRARWWLVTILLALAGLGMGIGWGTWTHICRECPSIAQIYAFEPKEATRVYARDGSVLTEFAVERRTAIPIAALPAHVRDAFIAIEDRRFWSHRGVDPLRTFKATVDYALKGPNVAGGSTITQQLAGNMFSSVDRREISVRRKLREMRVALALERAYTKQEILEAYLNQINFGHGAYGIHSAANRFFGKDARELNLPEAALLAALPNAPSYYSPIRHPERALGRRNLVLRLMAEQGLVTEADARAAMAYPLDVREEPSDVGTAPYFVEWVRQLLMEDYGMEIYEAGLRVYTTLDPALQAVADSALGAQLEWAEGQPGFRAPTYAETRDWSEDRLAGAEMPYLQGMFVALDPRTGDVLALIGGRDFEDSEFNRAVQARRQPGSVFKPFVYTAAIASGIPASEIMYDTPLELLQPDSTIWAPRNFTGDFKGPITLRQALYQSINVVAVRLGLRVGIESVAQFAKRMGLSTPIPLYPPIAIGAADVIPIEVAAAYTTFANLGVRVEPRPILRVEDVDGRVLWESRVQSEEVLERTTSFIVLSILRDVVERGTGTAVRRLGVPADVPVAGKTGTTNDATDAWFVGFTPEILTATWIGFDRPAKLHYNAQGGVDAAPVNAEVLRWYYEGRPAPAPWPKPDGVNEVVVDRTTGMLATPWCPAADTYTEYYLPGTEPFEGCDLHGGWNLILPTDSATIDSVPPVTDDFEF
jgi:1A family penicillin-binding protein